jgi:hypothetical protein
MKSVSSSSKGTHVGSSSPKPAEFFLHRQRRRAAANMRAAVASLFFGNRMFQRPANDFYLLKEGEGQFELYAKWKKRTDASPTIHKFIEVMEESIKDFKH